jgi:hypothetical protein
MAIVTQTTPSVNGVLDAALDYAARGWHVFPCLVRLLPIPLARPGRRRQGSAVDQVGPQAAMATRRNRKLDFGRLSAGKRVGRDAGDHRPPLKGELT